MCQQYESVQYDLQIDLQFKNAMKQMFLKEKSQQIGEYFTQISCEFGKLLHLPFLRTF